VDVGIVVVTGVVKEGLTEDVGTRFELLDNEAVGTLTGVIMVGLLEAYTTTIIKMKKRKFANVEKFKNENK